MGPVELGQTLGRIEAKVDAVLVAMPAKVDRHELEPAVRRIAWKWAAAVAGGIFAAVQAAQALGWLP